MTTQTVTGRALQKQRLDNLNNFILPKFKNLELLKAHLEAAKDPVLADALKFRIETVRNEIATDVIGQIPDFLDAISYGWYNCFSYDDAKSYVYEHLLEAIMRYKTTTVPFCKFTSFFWMYNRNIFRNKRKQERARKRDVTKTASLETLSEVQPDKFAMMEETLDNNFNAMALRQLYNRSTPKQKRILKRIYLGYSQSEIAKVLGVTGTNINTIIRKIRENFTENDSKVL